MPDKAKKRLPLSRDRWLELALDTLITRGKSKFSLDALIDAMPVGKGSFYHHFSGRAEFLIALVEFWDRKETQNVIDALAALPSDVSADDRLWELMCVVLESVSVQHELLIRVISQELDEVREQVESVDRKRFSAVSALFADMGFQGEELEMRTLAFATITTFDRLMFSSLSDAEYRRQLKLRHALFCQRLPE